MNWNSEIRSSLFRRKRNPLDGSNPAQAALCKGSAVWVCLKAKNAARISRQMSSVHTKMNAYVQRGPIWIHEMMDNPYFALSLVGGYILAIFQPLPQFGRKRLQYLRDISLKSYKDFRYYRRPKTKPRRG